MSGLDLFVLLLGFAALGAFAAVTILQSRPEITSDVQGHVVGKHYSPETLWSYEDWTLMVDLGANVVAVDTTPRYWADKDINNTVTVRTYRRGDRVTRREVL